MSFAIQNKWGAAKIKAVQTLITKIVVIDINTGDTDLINAYAEIDAYSKNKLPDSPIGSAITMGKNDIWIAATAKVADATLITIDGDFEHLHNKIDSGDKISAEIKTEWEKYKVVTCVPKKKVIKVPCW